MIRREVAEYIRSNPEVFNQYVDTDDSFDEFLRKLHRDGEWAGHPCIYASALKYQSLIFVHTSIGPTHRFDGGHTHTIHLAYIAHSHFDIIEFSREVDDIEQIQAEDLSKSLEPLSRSAMLHRIVSTVDECTSKEKPFSILRMAQTVLSSPEEALKYLKEQKIILTQATCKTCDTAMVLRGAYAEHPLGVFRCPTCNSCLSPLGTGLLSHTKLPLDTFLLLALGWLRNKPNYEQLADLPISERTLCSFNAKMNAFASIVITKHHGKIGGPLRIVEIDEALLHRRKSHLGRQKEQGWVLGGVERPLSSTEIPGVFLASCPVRSRERLEELILDNVEIGSIIITDCFGSYNRLDMFGYYHYTVNHAEHFINPATRAHTQRIEGFWHQMRRSLPSTGTRMSKLSDYLAAFLYRRRVANHLEIFLTDLRETSSEEVEDGVRAARDDSEETQPDLESSSVTQTSNNPAQSTPQSSVPMPQSPKSSSKTWTAENREARRMVLYSSDPNKMADNLVSDRVRSPQRQHRLDRLREADGHIEVEETGVAAGGEGVIEEGEIIRKGRK